MSYTTSEFERAMQPVSLMGGETYEWDTHIVLAALRIAANVMQPGVIEDAFVAALRVRGASKGSSAELIREALTHPKEGT